jgi:hypothetical protein
MDDWRLDVEFIQRLKTEPESALGVMELTLDILVHQFGAKYARVLVLDAVTKSTKCQNSTRTQYLKRGPQQQGEND